MRDEKAVASFYDKTTATFCVPVASSFAFGIPCLLEYTQSANFSGYAIADGFLTFINIQDLTAGSWMRKRWSFSDCSQEVLRPGLQMNSGI
jgi:hypothetical protein